MCRVLEVTASGYYAWQLAQVSAREWEKIRAANKTSRPTYGSPRIQCAKESLVVAIA